MAVEEAEKDKEGETRKRGARMDACLSREFLLSIARPRERRDEFEPLDPASSGLEYVAGDSCAPGWRARSTRSISRAFSAATATRGVRRV